jgi:hypothetical protein
MPDNPLLRSAAIFLVWLVGPFVGLLGLARAGVVVAMAPLLPLYFLIYPHGWFVRRANNMSIAVFSSRTAVLAAILQWAVVTVAFAFLTRNLTTQRQAILAPVVIIVVGVVVQVIVHLLGIEVEADWL